MQIHKSHDGYLSFCSQVGGSLSLTTEAAESAGPVREMPARLKWYLRSIIAGPFIAWIVPTACLCEAPRRGSEVGRAEGSRAGTSASKGDLTRQLHTSRRLWERKRAGLGVVLATASTARAMRQRIN